MQRWQIAVGLLVMVAGCTHDLDSVALPCGAAQACPDGQRCVSGKCEAHTATDQGADLDATLRDGPAKDRAADTGPGKDMALPDKAPADKAADRPLLDQASADTKAQPDLTLPDQTQPDTKGWPDLPPPLPSVGDDTYLEFNDGSSKERGAKLHVSHRGNLQILDRLDLDLDGKLDLLVTNHFDGKSYTVGSQLFWGTGTKAFDGPATLPSTGAAGASVADLDDDGYPDVVISNRFDGAKHSIDSLVYWGKKGRAFDAPTKLATHAARANVVADLDADGYLDVVFANSGSPDSYVYWGKGGRQFTGPTKLKALGANGVVAADFNQDNKLDLLIVRRSDGSTLTLSSPIYFGNGLRGFTNTWNITTVGGVDATVADLNSDSYLDIVVANAGGQGATTAKSAIYYFSTIKLSYPVQNKSLPTYAAQHVTAAHLDGNSAPDLVFSNYWNNKATPISYSQTSHAYLTSSGTSYVLKGLLPTNGAMGNLVLDFNGDGYNDIFVAQEISGDVNNKVYAPPSRIFWGGIKGIGSSVTTLATKGASAGVTNDPGSQFTRSPSQTFFSRIFDSKKPSPQYQQLSWVWHWTGKTAPAAPLKFKLRSAATISKLKSSPMSGPAADPKGFYTSSGASINPKHSSHQYIQYQVELVGDYGNTPVLDKVSISFK